MKDFIHKNAKQFASMNDAVHKEFKHMDKQLVEIKKQCTWLRQIQWHSSTIDIDPLTAQQEMC
jgi:hypothetical protein